MEKSFGQNKNKSLPSISVVIPAYNEASFLAQALQSLKEQDYDGQFEVIVVDNASTDNTAEIAKQFGAVVLAEPRKGVQYARQRGFLQATGDYIASTDADNILPKGWLTKLASELEQDEQLLGVGGWFRLQKGNPHTKFLINYFSTPTLIFYHLVGIRHLLIGQNFMVKKEAFLRVGGFETETAMNEDLILATKLALIGKVTLHYGKQWAVYTSPRRWTQGFIRGSLPYFINSWSFALFNKIAIKDFKDIRNEHMHHSLLRQLIPYCIGFMLFLLGYSAIPITPAHAKIAPVTKLYSQKIVSTVKNLEIKQATSAIMQETREHLRLQHHDNPLR